MNITITKAQPSDARELLEVLKIIGGETDNLTFGSEGFPATVEEEEAYLASLVGSTSSAMFIVRKDGKLVGSASFRGMERTRLKHRAEIGISLLKEVWGQGIGSMLMETLIDFAKTEAHVEIISLEVNSENTRAIRLYEKYGFEKIGHYKGFFKVDGKYLDFDLMNLYL